MKDFIAAIKGMRPCDWVVSIPWLIGIPIGIIGAGFAFARLAGSFFRWLF